METKSPAFQLWDGDMLVEYVPEEIISKTDIEKIPSPPAFLNNKEFRWIHSSQNICQFTYKGITYLTVRDSLIDDDREGWLKALMYRAALISNRLPVTFYEGYVGSTYLCVVRIG